MEKEFICKSFDVTGVEQRRKGVFLFDDNNTVTKEFVKKVNCLAAVDHSTFDNVDLVIDGMLNKLRPGDTLLLSIFCVVSNNENIHIEEINRRYIKKQINLNFILISLYDNSILPCNIQDYMYVFLLHRAWGFGEISVLCLYLMECMGNGLECYISSYQSYGFNSNIYRIDDGYLFNEQFELQKMDTIIKMERLLIEDKDFNLISNIEKYNDSVSSSIKAIANEVSIYDLYCIPIDYSSYKTIKGTIYGDVAISKLYGIGIEKLVNRLEALNEEYLCNSIVSDIHKKFDLIMDEIPYWYIEKYVLEFLNTYAYEKSLELQDKKNQYFTLVKSIRKRCFDKLDTFVQQVNNYMLRNIMNVRDKIIISKLLIVYLNSINISKLKGKDEQLYEGLKKYIPRSYDNDKMNSFEERCVNFFMHNRTELKKVYTGWKVEVEDENSTNLPGLAYNTALILQIVNVQSKKEE